MPALKEDFDYYGYARSRQGVARNATPNSGYNNTTSQKSRATREETKSAIRKVLNDDYIGSNKVVKRTKTTTNARNTRNANVEPVVFNKKEKLQKPEEMKLKKMQTKKKENKAQKQKAMVKSTFKKVTLIGLLFSMFFLICYRYTTINEAFNELNTIKNDLKNKETINAQMESQIKQNTDLAYIENYAKYQLGMQKPKASQIKKLTIEKQDKITTPIEIKEEEKESTFQKFLNEILKYVD